MGFSLNNQEPDGTPHQIRTVAPNSPAAKSGKIKLSPKTIVVFTVI